MHDFRKKEHEKRNGLNTNFTNRRNNTAFSTGD